MDYPKVLGATRDEMAIAILAIAGVPEPTVRRGGAVEEDGILV